MQSKITFGKEDRTLHGTLHDVSDIGVVLCPPHPLMGGSRYDDRLVHLANELVKQGISTLCFDYGEYGKGIAEIGDVLSAISYIKETKKCVGVLGYSFGAVVSSNAVSQTSEDINGLVTMSILRKVEKINADLSSDCKKLMITGKKDPIVPYKEFERLYSEAKGKKECLVLDTDHFYSGVMDVVSKKVCEFFNIALKKN